VSVSADTTGIKNALKKRLGDRLLAARLMHFWGASLWFASLGPGPPCRLSRLLAYSVSRIQRLHIYRLTCLMLVNPASKPVAISMHFAKEEGSLVLFYGRTTHANSSCM